MEFSRGGVSNAVISAISNKTHAGTAVLSIFIRLSLDVECKTSFRYRGSPFLRKFLPKMLFMTAPY